MKHYRSRITLFIDPCASRGMSSRSLDHASLPCILEQAPRVDHRPSLQCWPMQGQVSGETSVHHIKAVSATLYQVIHRFLPDHNSRHTLITANFPLCMQTESWQHCLPGQVNPVMVCNFAGHFALYQRLVSAASMPRQWGRTSPSGLSGNSLPVARSVRTSRSMSTSTSRPAGLRV